MNKKSGTSKDSADKLVRNIRRKTRQTYPTEEKIRIVLAGLHGEEGISALCRREGIAESLYYSWSKDFLEAGKRGEGEIAPRTAATTAQTTSIRPPLNANTRRPVRRPQRELQSPAHRMRCKKTSSRLWRLENVRGRYR